MKCDYGDRFGDGALPEQTRLQRLLKTHQDWRIWLMAEPSLYTVVDNYPIELIFPIRAPIRSHYWISEPHSLFSPNQPFVFFPDARAYARPEKTRLLFGFREAQSVSIDPRLLPQNMSGYTFTQSPNGWDSLLEGIPGFGQFFPLAEEIKISNYIKGLSSFTPDGNFVLGTFPGLEGLITATGCVGQGLPCQEELTASLPSWQLLSNPLQIACFIGLIALVSLTQKIQS